jgi:hypothetical protein
VREGGKKDSGISDGMRILKKRYGSIELLTLQLLILFWTNDSAGNYSMR